MSHANFDPNNSFILPAGMGHDDLYDTASARLGQAIAIADDLQARASEIGASNAMQIWGVVGLMAEAKTAFAACYDASRADHKETIQRHLLPLSRVQWNGLRDAFGRLANELIHLSPGHTHDACKQYAAQVDDLFEVVENEDEARRNRAGGRA